MQKYLLYNQLERKLQLYDRLFFQLDVDLLLDCVAKLLLLTKANVNKVKLTVEQN